VFAKKLLTVWDANVVIDDDDVFVDERRRRRWEEGRPFILVCLLSGEEGTSLVLR
jgi:hypothetical protein